LGLFSSCAKENDLKCSCDEEVNAWANKNINEIRTFSIEDVQSFDIEKVRASFRAFTPEQRYTFWQDKLEQVLSLSGWSADETKFLTDVKSGLKQEWFEEDFKNDETNVQQMNDMVDKWKSSAANLGWSKSLTYSVFGSPYLLKDKTGTLVNAVAKVNAPSSQKTISTESCGCSTSDDWCATQSGHNDYCKSGSCTTSSWGCGWGLAYKCTGLCTYL
jgi:hypothetical protein